MSEAIQAALARHHESVITDALARLQSPDMACLAHLRPGLRSYLTDRIPTGSFLRAALENDWCGAIRKAAPDITMQQMRALHHVLAGAFPGTSWGSPEMVAAWLKEKENDGNFSSETD